MMLISPDEHAAVVVSARRVGPIFLAQRVMFGSLFDSDEPTPRPLSRNERGALRTDSFIGRYQKGSLVLDVAVDAAGEMQAAVYRRAEGRIVDDKPIVSRTMLPAMANTLYPVPPEPNVISFLRFFGDSADGCFRYAYTGKHLFRRT